jgi:uncharacterized protein YbaP (TraB family)
MLAAISVAAQTSAGEEIEKTFLWKVDGGESCLYLLGSIHALRDDAYPLPQPIEAAFDEAEVLVFEIDVGDMTKAAITMMGAGTLDEGSTLEELVGPETWFELKVLAGTLGLDPAAFNRMKPWMAALTLAAFELTKHGYLATAGLDTYFSRRANEAGKECLALETAEFQVSLFADLTPEQSLAFLRYTLADLETMIPEMERMYLDWRHGKVEPLEELMFEGFDEFPGVFERMVVDRNRAWVPKVVELLQGDRDAMVVVGSMHLIGEHGLIALLQQQGYAVTQL